jgi:uncharacterized membrane protein YbhN (UPF0104 family)
MASFPQRIPGGLATAEALTTPIFQAAFAAPMALAMASAQARP